MLKRARFAVATALVMAPGARPARATARLATQPSAHLYFVTNAAFSYLGPSFAVLLFARVQVLGVVWLRIVSAAVIFAAWRRPWRTVPALDRRGRELLLGWGPPRLDRCPAAQGGVVVFRVLGPLEVRTGSGWTAVGAPKQRAVLAALVQCPGKRFNHEPSITCPTVHRRGNGTKPSRRPDSTPPSHALGTFEPIPARAYNPERRISWVITYISRLPCAARARAPRGRPFRMVTGRREKRRGSAARRTVRAQ